MDTEKVKQNPAVEAAGSSGGQAARIFKKENIPKTAETVGRDTFEEWMGRIMERFDRQDRIISVLVNKDAAGVKYLDGERLYDNQDLSRSVCKVRGLICRIWHTSVLSSHSLRRFSSALRQNLSTIPASRLKRAINSSKVFCSITITFSIRLPFNCDYAAK